MASKKETKVLLEEIDNSLRHGKVEEALRILRENVDDLFSSLPAKTIELDLSLRYELAQFDEAYEDLDDFESRPYMNQETEEILRDARKQIRAKEKAFYQKKEKKPFPVYDSSLPEETLASLTQDKAFLETKEAASFFLALTEDLSRPGRIRTLGLLALMRMNYPERITFKKNGSFYKLIPAKTPTPMEEPLFVKLYQRLEKLKDVSRMHLSLNLLTRLSLALFPEKLSTLAEEESLYKILVKLSEQLFGKLVDFKSEGEEQLYRRVYELIFESTPKGSAAEA